MGKFDSLPSSGNKYALTTKWNDSGSNNRSYGLWLYNNGGTNSLLWGHSTDGTNQAANQVTVAWSPSVDIWYHVAVVYDSSTPNVKFYVNGTQQGSTQSVTGVSIFNGNSTLGIGTKAITTPVEFMDGKMDEIRIWNVARTVNQISDNKSIELAGSESGLAAYYPFESLLQSKITYFTANDEVDPAFLNDSNLRAYYKLENTSDSKNSYTLTNNGGISFNSAKYDNGGDLGTSNSTKYFQTSNDLGLGGNGAFAFSFWVKLQTEISSGTYHLFEHGSTTQDMILRVRYEYNGGTRRLAFSRGKPGISDDAEYYSVNLGTNDWHHIIFMYDGTTIKGFLDGTEVVSAAKSGTGVSLPTAGFTIGGNNDDGNLASALFDDVAVFDRSLTTTEVSRIYNSTVGLGSIIDSIGAGFSRAITPITSGTATQANNTDGSVTVSVTDAPGYADSGFVLYQGTLGDLPNFTVNGTGDDFGLNIWFDKSNNDEYFAWNGSNVLTSLDDDTYGLSTGSDNGAITVNGSTQFFVLSDGQNHSLSDLENGDVSGISSSTKVAIWIGVNTTENGGSISSTINSISGL